MQSRMGVAGEAWEQRQGATTVSRHYIWSLETKHASRQVYDTKKECYSLPWFPPLAYKNIHLRSSW